MTAPDFWLLTDLTCSGNRLPGHVTVKMELALAALTSPNECLRGEVLRLETENKLLRAKVDKLVHRI